MVRLTESTVYIRTKCTADAVKKLNLWGCDIDDISICSKMKNLEVLSLSVNQVSSLEPLKDCTKLRELYLRKNNIENLTELEHLKDISTLRVLWIDENPCTSVGEYRFKVVRILPQLTKLDDKPVTQDDHLEPEESVPECDMHASFYSTRSSRSSAHTIHNDLMTRSLYVGRGAIVDTVMQPQIASFVDASDEEPVVTSKAFQTVTEDDWGDFSFDDEARPCSMDGISSRMCMSMYDERPRQFFNRSASQPPRRRITARQQSASPHRQQRLTKIISAVSVLMEDLDQDGLRMVIEEAQQQTPTVSCGPTALSVSAVSSDVFEGQVFIKSQRSASPDCLALFDVNMNSTTPSFSLPLSRISSCGLEMIRDNEAKSLRLSTVIVFAFHPQFVTAGDRAFAVHCLFQQKDVHVETQFDFIHDIQSTSLRGVSIEVPQVEMKIVGGRDEGAEAVQQVQVGAPIMLVWKIIQPSREFQTRDQLSLKTRGAYYFCGEVETAIALEMYGIRILDCIASDANGDGQPVLDDGCATDDHLLSNVRYSAADDRAFSEVIAFKMPDEEQLFFRCRIGFCIRKTARILAANTIAESAFCKPSSCDVPRQRRETVLSGEPIVIVGQGVQVSETLPLVSAENVSSVCLSDGIFAITASLSATIYTAAVATGAVLIFKNIRRKRSFSF